jgi:transcriptional regulator with XRE-family HTH domain
MRPGRREMKQTEAQKQGARISTARKLEGLSIRALAERVGISYGYLAKLERGEKENPSLVVLRKIADALSMDLQDILKGASVKSENALPEPHVYLRSLGLSGGDAEHVADIIAGLLDKGKEVSHEQDD